MIAEKTGIYVFSNRRITAAGSLVMRRGKPDLSWRTSRRITSIIQCGKNNGHITALKDATGLKSRILAVIYCLQ